MNVIKRNGSSESVSFDKVLTRVRKSARGLNVNPDGLAQQVLSQIYDGVKTSELDELTAQLAAGLSTLHPDYGTLAARISISNLHKNTEPLFSDVVKRLSNQTMPATGEKTSYVHQDILDVMATHGAEIDAYIKHDRDYLFDYFGIKTLDRAYLLRDTKRDIVERPQHMWMRVSLALWGKSSLNRAFETYDLLSQKFLTHATPTLFNAGTPRQQLSSCFLLAMADDSIAGIYKTLGDCAAISKHSGGIGLHLHNVRARGSLIRGTNGMSNGLVPMLRVFNNTARYVDQCFTPDTLVYTKSGAKMIEDISVTEQVLTSNGNYCAVNQPVRHDYDGIMLRIQVKNAISSVRVTPEHQVLALQDQTKGLNFDIIRNRLSKNSITPTFVDARDLRVGDFVVYTIPSETTDIETITEEDCRLYGIMLGDGHLSNDSAHVTLHKENKKDVADFLLTYLEARGIQSHLTEREDLAIRIRWSPNNPGFKFTRSQLYDSNKEKYIDPAFLHLPVNKIIQIVRGLIETDGCIGTKEVSIEMSSDSVIEGIRYMLLRLGALASGYDRDRIGNVSSYKNITTRKATKVLRVPRISQLMQFFPDSPTSEYMSYLTYENRVFSRIESITEEPYKGTVHDFEIAGPHDYTVAHLGISHNGGGKRNGSFAMYLEPWHADVEEFLKLKLPSGSEEERARDLFYALWIPDLFMERVEADGDWTLMCPNECPGLADVWGPAFNELYERYEREGRGRKTVKAQKLWFQVLDTQMESGTPYLLYKDSANSKSNQQNVGTIKSSNLCTEIIEYSSPDETAVCNLASLALPSFVNDGTFNFDSLRKATATATRNLNRVIDINYYPTPETERSNMRHRPIGLGVQGLADVFALLGLSWEDEKAAELNQLIFEHMYYAAVEASAQIAQEEGPYSTFAGSPASKGKLQPDLWNIVPKTETSGALNWAALRLSAASGLRNSLLIAPMPTASTSQILGFNECFEPFTTNLYTRRTLAGEFIMVNKYLLKDLMKAGLWSEGMKQQIIARNGSVQGIPGVPEDIQLRYKTTWEIKQKTLIDMAAARGAFICQSQSLNLFVADPTYAKLTSMHFYAWKQGLKTGCYYLRTKAPVTAQKFTVDPRLLAAVQNNSERKLSDVEDETYESDTDSDVEPEEVVVSAEVKAQQRKAKLDALAAEYEAEVKALKDAKDRGEEVCEMCSS
jgi:ribonucleoside-diphosphate reductase alpha chain